MLPYEASSFPSPFRYRPRAAVFSALPHTGSPRNAVPSLPRYRPRTAARSFPRAAGFSVLSLPLKRYHSNSKMDNSLSKNPLGSLGGLRPSQCHPNPATCAAGSEALRSKVQHITLPRGCRKERQAPSCAIRSGGVYAARSGCKPLPLSCSARALRAQEHDVPLRCKAAPNLAAKDCPQSNRKRRHIVSPDMDSGSDLVFRAVSSQVPSARRGLTSVFGMGTGGTLLPLPPERICSFPAP